MHNYMCSIMQVSIYLPVLTGSLGFSPTSSSDDSRRTARRFTILLLSPLISEAEDLTIGLEDFV